jgi:hypothetical protein
VDLSRDSIERRDLPRAADGLDPEAVADHLRQVADAVEKLTRSVRRLAAEIEERAAAADGLERRPAPPAAEPKPEPEPEPAAEPEPEPEPEPAAEPDPEPQPQPEPAPAAKPGGGGGGEAPRLIALNMVLNGASRDEVARYLDENFELENAAEVLDEVWKRAGN